MFYSFATIVCRIFLFFAYRLKVIGRENVPSEGGVLLVFNHRSYMDVVIAGVTCPRKLNFMAKSELFKKKFFARLISSLGAYPIQRGRGDIGAIKSTLAKLSDNEAVLIFPEGKRVKTVDDEKHTRAKPGAVMIAVHGKVPVVPVYISGKIKFMHKVTITYGKPIYYTEYYGQKLNIEQLQSLSDEMMKEIRKLKVVK